MHTCQANLRAARFVQALTGLLASQASCLNAGSAASAVLPRKGVAALHPQGPTKDHHPAQQQCAFQPPLRRCHMGRSELAPRAMPAKPLPTHHCWPPTSTMPALLAPQPSHQRCSTSFPAPHNVATPRNCPSPPSAPPHTRAYLVLSLRHLQLKLQLQLLHQRPLSLVHLEGEESRRQGRGGRDALIWARGGAQDGSCVRPC